VAGVLLTDPEIDHALGLMILRESPDPVQLYCSATVRWALSSGFPILPALDGYCGVDWHEVHPGELFRLPGAEDDEGLEVEAFALPGDPPLYMKGSGEDRVGYQVGLTFRDPSNGAAATYAPGLATLDDAVMERFEASDLIMVDGTFWTNDEMEKLGISGRTALDMGHLPLSGEGGSLERLSSLSRPRKLLVHINNTNPILREDSAERKAVETAGVEVATDGLTIRVGGGNP